MWLTAQWHSIESLCRVLVQTRKNHLFFFDCTWLNQLWITQVTRRCVPHNPQTAAESSKAFQKATIPSLDLTFVIDFDGYPYTCLNHQLLPLMSREPYGVFGYHSYNSGCHFRPKPRNILEQKTALFSSNNYLLKTSSLSVILMFIYTFIVICA